MNFNKQNKIRFVNKYRLCSMSIINLNIKSTGAPQLFRLVTHQWQWQFPEHRQWPSWSWHHSAAVSGWILARRGAGGHKYPPGPCTPDPGDCFLSPFPPLEHVANYIVTFWLNLGYNLIYLGKINKACSVRTHTGYYWTLWGNVGIWFLEKKTNKKFQLA